MKKAFTIIELMVSIALLSIILVVTTSIFITAMKNYQITFQKNSFQKDINFLVDDITKNIKASSGVKQAHDTFSVNILGNSSNTLILEIPTTNSNGDFVYDAGGILQKDVYVYYLSGNSLHRKLFANSFGNMYPNNLSDSILTDSVDGTSPIFTYLPNFNSTSQVQINLTLAKEIQKTNIKATGSRTAGMKN